MSAKASYYKIGLFVLGASALGVVGVIVLGAAAIFKDYTYVTTYLDESVGGLSVGSPVKLRGVDIGRVSEIRLAADKFGLTLEQAGFDQYRRFATIVVVTIAIEDDQVLRFGGGMEGGATDVQAVTAQLEHAGWRIRLTSSGLTSPPHLELVPDTTAPDAIDISGGVPWQDEHKGYIFIPAAKSQMLELTSSVEAVLSNLEQTDMARMTASVTAMVENELTPMIRNLNDGISQLPELMEKLDNVAGNVDTMSLAMQRTFNEDLPPIIDNMQRSTRTMPDLMVKIESAVDSIDKLAASIDRMASDDISPTLAELRELVASLDKLSTEELQPALANINQAADDMPATVQQFNSGLRRMNLLVADGQSSLGDVLENLRTISQDLKRLSANASRYPAHTLFGDPPPRSLNRDK